ncbi:endo-1,4-beta-xylanase [Adonisia turfae]|nr:endo-1,4-beta-xylanase [Adonisia turfae]
MLIGSKYIHKDPGIHKDFKHITLDAWSEGSEQRNHVDSLLEELKLQGKVVHGHNILDKRYRPKVQDLEELLSWVRTKVLGVSGIHSWDVLNEMLGIFPDRWLLAVLEEMRNLQPNSLLFWNEYALKNRDYWNQVMQLAEIAKQRGILDGLGIQRHIDIRGKLPYSAVTKPAHALECHLKSWTTEKRLVHEINRIHELELLCHISEISIVCFPGQEDVAQSFLDSLIRIAEKAGSWKATMWGVPIIKVIAR